MKSGIYCIRNVINNKLYVGSSKNIKDRLIGHKRMLRKGSHDNDHLQHSWDKYGEEYFDFYALEEVEEVNLLKREQFWIDEYKSCVPEEGYNINPKANASPMLNPETAKKVSESLKGNIPWNKGLKGSQAPWNKGKTGVYSDETKQKIGSAMRGKKHSEETKKKMSESNKGIKRPQTDEHKKNLRKALKGRSSSMKGKKHSEEAKKKMSMAHKGKIISEETKLKMSKAQKERLKK